MRTCQKVIDKLTRFKHWFQYDDGEYHDQTLVIAQFRDPYRWVLSMKDKPHQSPLHSSLHWKEFVTKPWTMPREGYDLLVTDMRNRICSARYRFNEVISCMHQRLPGEYFQLKHGNNAQHPMYELRNDGSGEPFANILELRAAKIRNFMASATFPYVERLLPVKYESLVYNGTAFFIKEIEKITGVKSSCTPTPPQNRTARKVSHGYLQYMNKHIDWEAEALVGYEQEH